MRAWTVTAALAAALFANPAGAYEYGLQFPASPGARGLVVAGYAFSGDTVVGNCSYYTVTSGSGRGGGYHSHTTYYNQTCTWDLHGVLLGMTQGAPTPPVPLSTTGGLTIYARNAHGDVTGIDTAHANTGFVNTPSAQYRWATQGGYVFLPNQTPVDVTLTLESQGDYSLIVTGIDATALLAKASVKSTTCERAHLRPFYGCTIVVTYDPSALPGGDNPYTAYDRLTVAIVSNSGQSPDFSESIEVPVAPGN